MAEDSYKFEKTVNSLNMFVRSSERINVIAASPERGSREGSVGILN